MYFHSYWSKRTASVGPMLNIVPTEAWVREDLVPHVMSCHRSLEILLNTYLTLPCHALGEGQNFWWSQTCLRGCIHAHARARACVCVCVCVLLQRTPRFVLLLRPNTQRYFLKFYLASRKKDGERPKWGNWNSVWRLWARKPMRTRHLFCYSFFSVSEWSAVPVGKKLAMQDGMNRADRQCDTIPPKSQGSQTTQTMEAIHFCRQCPNKKQLRCIMGREIGVISLLCMGSHSPNNREVACANNGNAQWSHHPNTNSLNARCGVGRACGLWGGDSLSQRCAHDQTAKDFEQRNHDGTATNVWSKQGNCITRDCCGSVFRDFNFCVKFCCFVGEKSLHHRRHVQSSNVQCCWASIRLMKLGFRNLTGSSTFPMYTERWQVGLLQKSDNFPCRRNRNIGISLVTLGSSMSRQNK